MTHRRLARAATFAVTLAAGLALPLAVPQEAAAQPVLILVRHAEKADQSKDPPLSAEGEARAQRLASMLAATPITRLFVTHYQRTQATLAPLAKASAIQPEVLQSTDIDGLIARVKTLRPADVAVYAGHSDSVPQALAALGHREPIKIDDADYGNLFIVVLKRDGPPTVVQLRY